MTADNMEQKHDYVNIVVLSFIFLASVASLMHGDDSLGHRVVIGVMVVYLLIDASWVLLVPGMVKTPTTIVVHHIVTLVVIAGAVHHGLAHMPNASRALVVEINTVLITLRRILGRPMWCEAAFYGTWVIIRLVWFPLLGAALLASTYGWEASLNAKMPSWAVIPIRSPPIPAYASICFVVIVTLQFWWTFELLFNLLFKKKKKSKAVNGENGAIVDKTN
eukprot:TRINITY_DN50731_c0_g1_i2.p1 TRINITY_DN50731_c0_g1~~TRINITY_DN50731_c0_g1_i2.p1  ORF type:complete len:220 (-),score=38.07 TRINITY_DN50731_c0_g1_i2:166-825(-)